MSRVRGIQCLSVLRERSAVTESDIGFINVFALTNVGICKTLVWIKEYPCAKTSFKFQGYAFLW